MPCDSTSTAATPKTPAPAHCVVPKQVVTILELCYDRFFEHLAAGRIDRACLWHRAMKLMLDAERLENPWKNFLNHELGRSFLPKR